MSTAQAEQALWPGNLRKWFAIGTGVGIEITRRDLNITVTRVRPSGVQVLGSLTINNFRDQPAAEWGAIYNNFLRKLSGNYLTATIMLPREEVIVRQVALPGVNDRDVPAALNYQIESLHPYSQEEAVYGWARIRKTATILVGIVRREVLEKYTSLFNEAGIKVSAFTFCAGAIYAALRVYTPPNGDGFLAIAPQYDDQDEHEGFEVYGESPARPLFSAGLDMPEDRARTLALSELRLPPDAEALAFDVILPKPLAAPQGDDLTRSPLLYATALSGACPRLAQPVNLLPEKDRAIRSRWLFVPTIVIGVILLLLIVAVSLIGSYETRRQLQALEQERARVEPKAKRATALERDIAVIRNRTQSLDNFRARSRDDMDALAELSRILAPPTWLNSLLLSRTQLAINGETDQATPLLKALDGTKQFKRSEFTLPMTRIQGGEAFSIRSVREGVSQ